MTEEQYQKALAELWNRWHSYGPSYHNYADFKMGYEELQRIKNDKI